MYESHFGISGPPFQLNPDPGFYFDSRGHQGVLAQLHGGLKTGRGIVVLSGEVGAGKTTIARSIVAELEGGNVVVAQIFSSQLDAADLVDAALIAFGAPRGADAEATPIERLRRHLESLEKADQRALLLIDEAQNLPDTSFELLKDVVSADDAAAARLQVWLIGQPELRQMLDAGELAALKRHVVVACHLGPIGSAETGPYIEHRLRHVGWSGTPAFAPGAFEAVYHWTDGVPRRINMLCNRLMLASFLGASTTISADMVGTTASDLLAEIGEPAKLSVPPTIAPEPAPAAIGAEEQPIVLLPVEAPPPAPVARRPQAPAEAPLPTIEIPPPAAQPAPPPPVANPPRPADLPRAISPAPLVDVVLDAPPTRPPLPATAPRTGHAPLLIVVAGYGDHVKAAGLWRAIADRSGTSAVKLVRTFPNTAFRLNRGLFTDMDAKASLIELDVADRAPSLQAAEITQRFGEVMRRDPPRAVVVFDGSDAALACALAAQAMGVPVAHVNAGLRLREQPTARDLTGKLVDEAAAILYTPEMAHLEQLAQEGVSRAKLACVGNLLVDVLQATLPSLGEAPGQRARLVVPAPYLAGRNGFALVMMTQPVDVGDRAALKNTVEVVGSAARDLPLLWAMHDPVRDLFIKSRFDRGLSADRITVIAMQPFSVYVDILRSATCVITDSWNVQEEAAALGVPCVVAGMRGTRPAAIGQRFGHAVGMSKAAVTRAVWDCIFTGGRRPVVPPQWDGQTGARLVDHLLARAAAPTHATA